MVVALGHVGRGIPVGIELHKGYRDVLKCLVDVVFGDVEHINLPIGLIMYFEACCVESRVHDDGISWVYINISSALLVIVRGMLLPSTPGLSSYIL